VCVCCWPKASATCKPVRVNTAANSVDSYLFIVLYFFFPFYFSCCVGSVWLVAQRHGFRRACGDMCACHHCRWHLGSCTLVVRDGLCVCAESALASAFCSALFFFFFFFFSKACSPDAKPAQLDAAQFDAIIVVGGFEEVRFSISTREIQNRQLFAFSSGRLL
jgi:hypothetical protein